MENKSQLNPSDLPFLVTHWLSNFRATNQEKDGDDAIRRIHDAARHLSSAFSDLGLFGTANKPVFSIRESSECSPRYATYEDKRRLWSKVPPDQLENIAETLASIEAASSLPDLPSTDLLQMAREIRPVDGGGRRLGDIIDLTQEASRTDSCGPARSILHTMPLFGDSPQQSKCSILPYQGPLKDEKNRGKMMNLAVVSEFETIAESTGEAMRLFLSIREEVRLKANEIVNLQKAIHRQKDAKESFAVEQKEAIKLLSQQSTLESYTRSDFLKQEIQNCDRVIAQLTAKLDQMVSSHNERQRALFAAEREARNIYTRGKRLAVRFRNPFQLHNTPSLIGTLLDNNAKSRNHLTSFLMARQAGVSLIQNSRRRGRPASIADIKQTRKAVLGYRLHHAVTINAHLSYPIYCIQFDKSGRYFITGADDCLVKLFCIGAGKSKRPSTTRGSRTFSYGANARGAVLVCTLRGHAGVICDIDVSCDNAFVATASDDGDVRVWGLKDGCPIAILRGHEGGANMVSWSNLTPYRLVTSGMDGLGRIWDIREASLRRYGAYIGKRHEYTLPLSESEKHILRQGLENYRSFQEVDDSPQIMLPPLPLREGDISASAANPAMNVALPQEVRVVHNLNEAVVDPPPNNIDNPGAFVANDALDEGVRIVAKLQHGELLQDGGPGTRSRRKRVKVICVARCPRGGSFATGSDDGLCRVWEDEDDERLALIDNRGKVHVNRQPIDQKTASNHAHVSSTSKLLMTLVGHMSSITDLHYSHAGDRILTASQKDGNARIWSFGDSSKPRSSPLERNQQDRFRDPKQIVLRLSNVDMGTRENAQGRSSRRRGGNSANNTTSSVTCDVAVWTSDDLKIVTSQSCQVNRNSQDIIPGSQLLLVWDSWTGHCLLSISQAHNQQCPVVITHPLEPTIICSAGLDGVVKVWDLESGRCLFRHKNNVSAGPAGPSNERSKEGGYLDGIFDPHGHHLLLTDDSGQISIFDCCGEPLDRLHGSSLEWMTEQYFANDYYELFYNSNGYCVERGSEQPPHLAPRAARCNHAGAPWSDDISETFRLIKGPSPTAEDTSTRERKMLRSQAKSNPLQHRDDRRAIIMMDFDPARAVQVTGSAEMFAPSQTSTAPLLVTREFANNSTLQQASNSVRTLSNNYRWRDYEDLIREEGLNDAGDPDVGDEEFVPRGAAEDDDDDFSDSMLSESESHVVSNVRSSGRRSNRTGDANDARSQRANRREHERARVDYREVLPSQPARASSRRNARTNGDDSDEENEVIEEVLSTNNSPSGPYIDDYNVDGHLFKLGNLSARVNRAWLLRTESSSSYKGRKVYSPQVGDSVVYIPRAHAETIRAFPTLKAPWKSWPTGTSWPIVRCRVANVRYRFPFKDYFRRTGEAKCVSVVAVLTLEVTGIPELSADREFPWPKPTFINRQARSSTQIFEVSVFESGQAEYIVPEQLFLWRLRCLEDALRARSNDPLGLKVVATYVPDDSGEDPTFTEYEAEVIRFSHSDEVGDEQLNKSGFESLNISWVEGNNHSEEQLSPWEVTIPEETFNTPVPDPLPLSEKRAAAKALRIIESNEAFKVFLSPVDIRRYPDYLARIEVPMDTGKIKERLGQDYYVSLLHLLNDVKLIRANCLKYNGQDEIGLLAMELFSSFRKFLREELSNLGVNPFTIAEVDEDGDFFLHTNPSSTSSDNLVNHTPVVGALINVSSLELLPAPASQEIEQRAPSTAEHLSLPRRAAGRSVRSSDSALRSENILGARNSPLMNEPSTQRSLRNCNDGRTLASSAVSDRVVESLGFNRSTRSSRYRSEVGESHNEEYTLQASLKARPARSQRLANRAGSQKIKKEQSYDEDDYEDESSDDYDESDDFDDDESNPDDDIDGDDVMVSHRRRSCRSSSRRASVLEVASRSNHPRRQSRRNRGDAKYQDEESDVEMKHEAQEKNARAFMAKDARQSTRSTRSRDGTPLRSTNRRQLASSRRDREEEASDSEDVARHNAINARMLSSRHKVDSTPSRRSQRTRNSGNFQVENLDSHDANDHVDDGDASGLLMVTRQRAEGGTTLDLNATKKSSDATARASRRWNSRGKSSTSYQEVDSDFEDDSEPEGNPVRRRSRRRAADDDDCIAAEPRKKRSRLIPQSEQAKVPGSTPWPKVPLKKISVIGEGVLDEMRKLDSELNAFEIPVVEAVPSIASAYRRAISIPMDFRTIEEERLPSYESISELQDDLILVFQNCVQYNGEENQYGVHALSLWEQLDKVFLMVCKKERVRLPAGWQGHQVT